MTKFQQTEHNLRIDEANKEEEEDKLGNLKVRVKGPPGGQWFKRKRIGEPATIEEQQTKPQNQNQIVGAPEGAVGNVAEPMEGMEQVTEVNQKK